MTDSIRWFDHNKSIGLNLYDDEGKLILRLSNVEHHLDRDYRKRLLRALLRMRDFEEGLRQRAREEPSA